MTRMRMTITAAALLGGLIAGPASGAYVQAIDPTGTTGGAVVGVNNGDRAVEGGLCNRQPAFFPGYYYFYASVPSGPAVPGSAGAKDGCSGDKPRVTGASHSGAQVKASVDPNGLPTTVAVQVTLPDGRQVTRPPVQVPGDLAAKQVSFAIATDAGPGDYTFTLTADNTDDSTPLASGGVTTVTFAKSVE